MYVLTPWSRALLEKLISSQLVKKLLAFYGTPRFITAFMTALLLFQINILILNTVSLLLKTLCPLVYELFTIIRKLVLWMCEK